MPMLYYCCRLLEAFLHALSTFGYLETRVTRLYFLGVGRSIKSTCRGYYKLQEVLLIFKYMMTKQLDSSS